jgi:hypothetical protein
LKGVEMKRGGVRLGEKEKRIVKKRKKREEKKRSEKRSEK